MTESGLTVFVHYVHSPAGLVAVVARSQGWGTDNVYYTYTDHLGSILRLVRTDQSIVTQAEQSFDAWGRRRNPDTWQPLAPTAPTGLPYWLIRGYTAHEQLDRFGLVNMNGRLYDPALGRMLSADNYVQDPLSTQSFNRYSYVWNNPLTYNDPDGEWVHIAAGAVVGGVVNLGVKAFTGRIGSFRDGLAAFGIGAVAGGVGAATGGAAFLAAGGGAAGSGGFLAGAAGGLAGSAASSPIQGLGNAAYFGDTYGAKDFGRDLAFGAVFGGAVNGTIAAFSKTPSGLPRNFWNGDVRASGAGTFSMRNSAMLRQQGWARTETGRWSQISGGDMVNQFPDFIDPNGVTHQGGSYTINSIQTTSLATYYPANGGAAGQWSGVTLRTGQIIDRFGSTGGNYFSPQGTPAYMRALPYEPTGPPSAYEVLKPFHVLESRVAPAFGKTGFGIQYKSYVSVQDLIDAGLIRPIR